MNKQKHHNAVMEVDYHDLALAGKSPSDIEQLFANCAQSGITQVIWSTTIGGAAEYHSNILPLYDGSDRIKGWDVAVRTIKQTDPLEIAVLLAKKYNIKLIAYFRMFDDYVPPSLIDKYIDSIPGGWWESRCGRKLLGWPSYWLKSVRDHKLRIVKEIADYGVDGFLFNAVRSHSIYFSHYRDPLFFGYNPPLADEYLRRYNVDIRSFDYVNQQVTNFAGNEYPLVNKIEYVGINEFDVAKWHWLKGESIATFISEARKLLGRDKYIGLQTCLYTNPPFADVNDPIPAKFFLDPRKMIETNVIDEVNLAGNFKTTDCDTTILPHYSYILDSGHMLSLWLNDLFAPDGGGATTASVSDVEHYFEKFIASHIPTAIIHEAACIECHSDKKRIWELIKTYFK